MFSVLAAAPASAAPDDRAAAEAFADAARVYTIEERATEPEARRVFEAVDLSRCVRVTDRLERLGAKEHDRAVLAERPTIAALLMPVWRPRLVAIRRFVAALESVETQDPALRSGRAAWRQRLARAEIYARAPEDTCVRLEAWARAGGTDVVLPDVDLRGLYTAFFSDADNLFGLKKLAGAANRLRDLGQGPARASRFIGSSSLAYVSLLGEGTGVLLGADAS